MGSTYKNMSVKDCLNERALRSFRKVVLQMWGVLSSPQCLPSKSLLVERAGDVLLRESIIRAACGVAVPVARSGGVGAGVGGGAGDGEGIVASQEGGGDMGGVDEKPVNDENLRHTHFHTKELLCIGRTGAL